MLERGSSPERSGAARQERGLFRLLRELELPADDYVIFGSAPLAVRGIIPAVNDLDVVCRGSAWEAVCAQSAPERNERWGVELVELYGGRLTFGTEWAIGEVAVDELIETAEWIDGLPFARLDLVEAYKRLSGRPKDLDHLRALDGWRSSRSPGSPARRR